jgi:hypothetical protein
MITRSPRSVARFRYYRRLTIPYYSLIQTGSRVSKDIVSGDAASLVEASVILAQDIIGIYVYSLLNQWTIIVYHFNRVKDAIVLSRACQYYYARSVAARSGYIVDNFVDNFFNIFVNKFGGIKKSSYF